MKKKSFLIIGDVHGYWNYLKAVLDYNLDHVAPENNREIVSIFLLGDIGYKFTKYTKDLDFSIFRNIPTYWIDGNHDNHDYFKANHYTSYSIYDNVSYIPRGIVKNIYGKNILFIGGGVSIDRASRIIRQRLRKGSGLEEVKDYWEEEKINNDQELRAIESIRNSEKPIDIVMSHDAPDFFNLKLSLKINDYLSNNNRECLSRIGRNISNDCKWFFGHYHYVDFGQYRNFQWFCLNKVHPDDDQDDIIKKDFDPMTSYSYRILDI